ncbi:MAG TPA: hypothetical protein VLI40_10885, partial [Gemmatimonadaceae bacterium]|nr:hypothetical protein [Gemmatimonadaceae bacterium]
KSDGDVISHCSWVWVLPNAQVELRASQINAFALANAINSFACPLQRTSESQWQYGAAKLDGCSHSHKSSSVNNPAPQTGSSFSTFIIESDTKSSSSASSSGEDTSLYSKEVAHSRYRGNDVV